MRLSGLVCILYNIGKDNQTVRCAECQHKKQLEYQRNSMKKLRAKQNM